MNRSARESKGRFVLGALAVLGLACSAGPKMRVPEAMDVTPPQPLVLSAAAPSGEATPSLAGGAPQSLQIDIAHIDNPSRQAFTIAVFLVSPSPSSSLPVPIGALAPYPADQAGPLSLLVPPAVQSAITANRAPPRFRLVLLPAEADHALLAPLQVTVARLALGPG
jgi:hypothetical protein